MKMGSIALLVLIALVLGACSGSDDSSRDPSDTPSASTSPSTPESDEPVAEETTATTQTLEEQLDDAFDTAGGTATVSIGTETWVFELFESIPYAVCDSDFFGGFTAVLTSHADLTSQNNGFGMVLPGGDLTEPPSVTVTIADDGDVKWIADETVYEKKDDLPAGLGVTSFSLDGNTASGTALFYEEESYHQLYDPDNELLTAEGTFEVTCASE